jgi:hypothetical protein
MERIFWATTALPSNNQFLDESHMCCIGSAPARWSSGERERLTADAFPIQPLERSCPILEDDCSLWGLVFGVPWEPFTLW